MTNRAEKPSARPLLLAILLLGLLQLVGAVLLVIQQ